MVGYKKKSSGAWSEILSKKLQNQSGCPLRMWRYKQLEKFLSIGFPDRKTENWRYTDISPISSQIFLFDKTTADLDITDFAIENSYRIVFVNGCFSPALSNLISLPEEIQLSPLRTILKNYRKRNFVKKIPILQTPFSLLNDGLFQDGMFLHIPKNFELKKPVHFLYLMKPNLPFSMTQTRNTIFLEENSRASVLEEYFGTFCCPTKIYFNNIVTQIIVGASANLAFYKLQQENNSSFHIANTQIKQLRNSQVVSFHCLMGGKIGREDLNYSLAGQGASCRLLGFYHLKNKQHIDNHTCVDHKSSGCTSQQIYNGIIGNKSKAVFNGKILVRPEADKTVAHQNNKNLMFSNESEINTKPELEIYNNDVTCTHGATVGCLDDETLFYLYSRGIDRLTAEYLLACAFAEEITAKLPCKIISERMYQKIIKKLTLSVHSSEEEAL
ncbi:Fe-S cluster assembly protein SufD [Coxiella endosymbiont of Amblyomma sculptum]|uniref:Fe-S cluster assembly protein SufD n=1 Tax=Coxiella endosymbiont of Amblyomma sculptum TaxID=2487929 RepID=UPI00132E788A|nr:Fe-S cluster assembly protein SufD [Coxiella endosymbiont of Amblyomma sculptum]QHG92528.1 Fe-S cluster assembly protein SufD [Coxiella endosymbiont of Amblyomma sculptum]